MAAVLCCGGGIAVLLVRDWQRYNSRGNASNGFLALQNIYLYVGTSAAPFELIVTGGQRLAINSNGGIDMKCFLVAVPCENTGGKQQRTACQQSEELRDFHVQLPFLFSRPKARKRSLRPMEECGLLIRFIRRRAVRRRYIYGAAKFALRVENNFMVECGWLSICDSP